MTKKEVRYEIIHIVGTETFKAICLDDETKEKELNKILDIKNLKSITMNIITTETFSINFPK